MVDTRQSALRRLILLMDAASISVSMLLAAVLHSALRSHFSFFKDPPPIEQYLLLAYITMPMMLGMTALLGLHRQFEKPFESWTAVWDLIRLHVAGLVGIALLVFLTQIPLNRSVVALFLAFTLSMMLLSRFVLQSWRRRQHSTGEGRAHILLVSNERSLLAPLVAAARSDPLGPDFVGVLAYGNVEQLLHTEGIPVLGGLERLKDVLHDRAVDEVVLATQGMSRQQFESVMAACDELGTPVRHLVLPEFHDGRRLGLERQYGLPFIRLAKLEQGTEAMAIKRALDVVGAGALILLLSPVMVLIVWLILMTMGRPVLYGQERIGYRGRRFRMLKFRSMVQDAEHQREALAHQNEMGGPVFKISRDPRITSLGRLLRKFSLDELPQLFNVLSGSMSLVGPRPLPVAEQQQISGPQRRRLSMKPGITGLWQVSGRSNIGFDEWMRLDLEYVDNWSLSLDIKLLLRTIPVVLVGRGAK